MPLIQDLHALLQRLEAGGWKPLFDRLGLDTGSDDLEADLLRDVEDIAGVRGLDGFEELCSRAKRLVEPGKPAESVLFHAIASPAVRTAPDGTQLTAFPTAADLDLAENVVFGLQPPSLADIEARFPDQHLAVGVFAREYRQKAGTVHAQHADMIFSRTGITRVGTLPPHWEGKRRAYSPLEPDDDIHAFRVLPCLYGVYITVQAKGDLEDFGPYKMDRTFDAQMKFQTAPQSHTRDAEHDFWVPVHKLFSGSECLKGLVLDVSLDEKHINEKLRRIHLVNMRRPSTFDTGFKSPQIDGPPFIIEAGLAEFLDPETHGQGALSAVPRDRLIEPATIDGKPLATSVPRSNTLYASFNIPTVSIASPINRTGAHTAPEWMHVRRQVRSNGSERDLNEFERVEEIVESGRVSTTNPYRARHYFDFTGDGWVSAKVMGLGSQIPRRVPSYSILSAPDFYPYVSQSNLLDWSMNSLPSLVREDLWETAPLALCDQRVAPNLALRRYGAPFVPEDSSVSAMVGLKDSAHDHGQTQSSETSDRTTFLPDGAAGFYAPGWATSIDFDPDDQAWHLAAHGLGSPFPEDAKLCAAISAFWPAVAPDSSRTSPRDRGWRVVAPMTDREIGLDDAPPWDGIMGPRVVRINDEDHLEEDDFAHVDYISSALDGQFTISETMKVDQKTYQARILATHRMVDMLRSVFGSSEFRMLSFAAADPADSDFQHVNERVVTLSQPAHAFLMVDTDRTRPLVKDPNDDARWLRQDRISARIKVFVDDNGMIVWRRDNGDWQTLPIG
ncbi:MAG: hypothetical protein ACR2QJ_02675 [Geminicoccaceae bacterium]